jgi:hypothetical protein
MIVGPLTTPRMRARRFMISGGVACLFGTVSLIIFTSVGAVSKAGVPAIIVPGLMLIIGISSGLYGLYLQSNLGADADVPQLDFSQGGRGAFMIAAPQPSTALLGPGQQQNAFPGSFAPQPVQYAVYAPQQQHGYAQPGYAPQGYAQPGYAQQQQQQPYQQQYPPSYEVQPQQQQTYVLPPGSSYGARP